MRAAHSRLVSTLRRSPLLFAVAFVPWSAYRPAKPLTDDAILPIRVASVADCASGIDFQARLAVTTPRRVRGLSRRKERLRSDEAMLFVFDAPRPVEIWMRDTWIPLGVSFFRPDGSVSASYDMKVEKEPALAETRYSSLDAVVTALEYSPEHYRVLKQGPRFLCVKSPKP